MKAAIQRHLRFYAALLCGLIAYAVARATGVDGATLAGGDAFYLVFLGLCVPLVIGQTPATPTLVASQVW